MLSETFYKLWNAGILQRGVWETIYMTVFSTAIAYALGQGATLVSALWGILVWKEFKGAPKKAGVLNFAMIILFLAGIALIIAAGQ